MYSRSRAFLRKFREHGIPPKFCAQHTGPFGRNLSHDTTYLTWMHIFLVGVPALDGGTLQKMKSLACPLPISVNCAIGLCIGFKNRFTQASHFYTTQNCVCFYTHYVLFSTFECQYSRLPVVFTLGVFHCALCTLFTIDFIMGVFQCALCTLFTT
jgi:hypothetical protein